MPRLSWPEVLIRKDLVGGDVQWREGDDLHRGPLAEVARTGDVICLKLPWTAQLDSRTKVWESRPSAALYVNTNVWVWDKGYGRVEFTLPGFGTCTIFPNGGNKLEGRMVLNLPPDSERLLSLFPDLPFNRVVVERAFRENGWGRALGMLAMLPSDATLQDVFKWLKHDTMREEFLWTYIPMVLEGVTRDDVMSLVY